MLSERAVKAIEELHRLKSAGALTEEEYDKAKRDILAGQPRPEPMRPRPIVHHRRPPPVLPEDHDVIGWALLPLRRYADFEGRSRRKEYWLFQLLWVAVIVVMVVGLVAAGFDDEYAEPNGFGVALTLLSLLALLGMIVPQLAVQARRFHDQNLSGLLVLINLIPYLGGLVAFVFMCIDGNRGENRFGPDPKE